MKYQAPLQSWHDVTDTAKLNIVHHTKLRLSQNQTELNATLLSYLIHLLGSTQGQNSILNPA